jgi:hypothetical protein
MKETDRLRTACPNCGKGLRVSAALQGKRVKCPSCGHFVTLAERTASASRSAPKPRTDDKGDAEVDAPPERSSAAHRATASTGGPGRWLLVVGGAFALLAIGGVICGVCAYFLASDRGPVVARQCQMVVFDPGPNSHAVVSRPGRDVVLVVELRNTYSVQKFSSLPREQIYLEVGEKRYGFPTSRATARSDGSQYIVLCFSVPPGTASATLHLGDDDPIPLKIRDRIHDRLEFK